MVSKITATTDPFIKGIAIDPRTVKIAFAASICALFILSPLSLFLGAAAGFALSRKFGWIPPLKKGEPIIAIPHLFCAAGAAGLAILGWTPLAFFGGTLFRWSPTLLSFAIGDAARRGTEGIDFP